MFFLLPLLSILATEPPPVTTTQPVPTFAPNQLPYKVTTDYVWSRFQNNATSVIECVTHMGPTNTELLPTEKKDRLCEIDGTSVHLAKVECVADPKVCVGNGPLGMGSSVLLKPTTYYNCKENCNKKGYDMQSSKVNNRNPCFPL